MRSKALASALSVMALASMSIGATMSAAPAHACVPGEDVNILCSNEQALVDDLAVAGITPVKNPRTSVNLAWRICGELYGGTPYDVEVQKVYRDNRLHLHQAQAIVSATVRNLCPQYNQYQ
ncbi:MAG TPA: DUF732 domain-containing protein [Mycobacterium sp.]